MTKFQKYVHDQATLNRLKNNPHVDSLTKLLLAEHPVLRNKTVT